jgi:orotate phosphoribosyltransferase
MNRATQKLLSLLQIHSFRTGEFTLASGKKSDFFIDCKPTILSSKGIFLCGLVFLQKIESLSVEINSVAAVPLGGCPIADSIAVLAAQREYPLDVLYIRPEKKDHGSGRQVERPTFLSEEVVLVEDVITTGGSSLRAIEILHREGVPTNHVIALVDRLEGGRENLEEAGVEVHSIFTRKDFLV